MAVRVAGRVRWEVEEGPSIQGLNLNESRDPSLFVGFDPLPGEHLHHRDTEPGQEVASHQGVAFSEEPCLFR